MRKTRKCAFCGKEFTCNSGSQKYCSEHCAETAKAQQKKKRQDFIKAAGPVIDLASQEYLSSSKTTLTDYQCVSTGCCTHVAKTETTIDNQHVTKSLQRYIFLPKQPKENTEKIIRMMIFLDWD